MHGWNQRGSEIDLRLYQGRMKHFERAELTANTLIAGSSTLTISATGFTGVCSP